jgi:hypothetical protein
MEINNIKAWKNVIIYCFDELIEKYKKEDRSEMFCQDKCSLCGYFYFKADTPCYQCPLGIAKNSIMGCTLFCTYKDASEDNLYNIRREFFEIAKQKMEETEFKEIPNADNPEKISFLLDIDLEIHKKRLLGLLGGGK